VLHADTRAALGLSLAGAVVVFDEAHNLVDAVNSAHSACVTGAR
jgi:chromosome transmission fidelity protein 1